MSDTLRPRVGEFPQQFGRYQLIERLAVGGMAELFLAQASGVHGFERNVVVKRLLPHMTEDAHFIAMFIDEAKLTARLSHPKIAQTYELGSSNGQLFIAMEYIDGLDALSVLRECAHRRQRLPAEISVWVGHEVLDALDFAHNQMDEDGKPLGIIHRDVSPSNVIMSRRGDVKLVDFGIARAVEQHHKTKSGTLKGKYGYMSPEQVTGQPVDGRSDLFSAGILLAEMLTGRRLFAAPNELDVLLMVRDASLDRLEKFGKHLSESMLEIVRRSLAKSPDERYQTAAAFRDALADWLFEERHRVTAAAVSEVVESLYGDARERRRIGLQSRATEQLLAAASASSGSGTHADASTAAASIESPSEAPRETESSALESEPALDLASGLELDLGDALELESGLDAIGSGPNAIGSMPRSASVSPGSAVNARVARAESSTPGQSAADDQGFKRYPSIQEALDSLVPQTLDPTARDYDDSPLTQTEQVRHVSSVNLPSPAELGNIEPPAPPRIDEIEDAPDESGTFSDTSPITVLFRLAVEQETGLLTAAVGAIRKEIYFAGGTPEFVSSNVASELFGAYLVAHNAISEGELAMTLAMIPHFGGKLGDTLVGLGLMKPLDVFRLLTEQVREKLIDVCTWPKGTYRYYRGRTNPRESFPLDLDGFEVLGAGALATKSEQIMTWVHVNAGRKPKSQKMGPVTPEHFKLGKSVRDVYNRLRGDETVSELQAMFTDDAERLHFLRLLKLLIATDLAAF